MVSSLRHRTLMGLIWRTIGQYGALAIRFVVLLILASILTPTDFGLVGMAMIFIMFADSISELGLVQAIIQRQDIGESVLSTAFWTNLSLGLGIGILGFIGAELITEFLGDPAAAPVLRALAIMFPISALSTIQRALIVKHLEFDRFAYRNIISSIAFGIVSISLAMLGAGVWSLVGGNLARSIVGTAIYWAAVPWRPKIVFSTQTLRELLQFGLPAFISAMFSRGMTNIDYFVVGRWLGTEALGYYTLAFQLAVVPGQRLIGIVRSVTFPAFSEIQDNLRRLSDAFLEGIQHLFVVITPLTILIIMISPWFINALYDDKWADSILPMQILAVAGYFYAFDITQSLYYAVGKPQIRIWIIGFRIALFAIFFFTIGASFGIIGVATGLVFAAAFSSLLNIKVAMSITGFSLGDILSPIWISIRAAIFASVPVLVFTLLPISQKFSSWFLLIGFVIIFLSIYLIGILPWYWPMLIRLSGNVVQKLRR